MSILIISLPRTGSSNLGKKLSIDCKFRYEFEPFNQKNPNYDFNYKIPYKNSVIKTIIFQIPHYVDENDRLDWFISLSTKFEKVILLSRKDITACCESWDFLIENVSKGFKSNQRYEFNHSHNYDNNCMDIKKWNDELNYLSNKLNIPLTYYEDIYSPSNLNNRLRIPTDVNKTTI